MTYVDKIVVAFGGVRPMARRLGRPSSTVSGWVGRGTIPDAAKAEVLAAARLHGISLSVADFFPIDAQAPERGAA